MFWVYGVDESGNSDLLGPFGDQDDARSFLGELNGARIIQAPNRQAALAMVNAQAPRPMLTEDEPRSNPYA